MVMLFCRMLIKCIAQFLVTPRTSQVLIYKLCFDFEEIPYKYLYLNFLYFFHSRKIIFDNNIVIYRQYYIGYNLFIHIYTVQFYVDFLNICPYHVSKVPGATVFPKEL